MNALIRATSEWLRLSSSESSIAPDLEIADNDYAVGLVAQKISESPFAGNTLVFVIEDDAQDGGDHVDSHRTIAFVAGPYVKQGTVVSTRYSTLNFLRTIEEVLGIPEINVQKGLPPMPIQRSVRYRLAGGLRQPAGHYTRRP
jgi:hypothetical protein